MTGRGIVHPTDGGAAARSSPDSEYAGIPFKTHELTSSGKGR